MQLPWSVRITVICLLALSASMHVRAAQVPIAQGADAIACWWMAPRS